ncbi:MAG: Inner membrane symporter YicJ [Firmicutes bacterium ADurb.Bin248]|mgnify:CR=1 FL=1|nr:MAG: Inner membrane symporter YicJ [Firmicutes bacterium ADurb.Bin248]HPK15801.1 MFS transporter [Clostridia bacterium]
MLKKRLGYACGDIYGGGSFLIFSMLFMNFLVLVEGMPVVLASAVIFAGRLWDAVTDPIMGNLTDRTRSRFGRRRVYFLAGIPLVFASFVMLWYSFGMQSVMLKVFYYIFAYMFLDAAFTVVMVPYNAILPDITCDYNERTRFTATRMAFSAGTAILAAVVPSILIKSIGGEVNGPAQKSGYLAMGLVFGAIFALGWLFTFLGTKEREDLPEPEPFSIREWFSVFRNKTYRIFLGIFIFVQVAIDLLLAIFIFYIDIVVLQYKNYEVVMGVLLVCQLLFMFMHNKIAQKKGKHYPLFVGIPVWIAASAGFAFVSSTTPLWVILALAVLIAAGAAAGNLSTWAMLSDTCEVDELITGKRREGIYSGFTTFARKCASGAAVLVMGFGLQLAGFDQLAYNQARANPGFDPAAYAESSAGSTIKWMFVVIPIVFLLAALAFALRYKLDNKRFERVIGGIEKLKAGQPSAAFSAEELADFELLTGRKAGELWPVNGNPPAGAG